MIVTRLLIALSLGVASLAAQSALPAPNTLPAAATGKLAANLAASKPHAKHVWRDTPPTNDDGTINGYIEIAEGDRQKWELNMAKNARAIDRMIPESLGGYPINYGFVPQTVSYDGDPFDVLVLGPPIEGGRTVRGKPVGVMFMQDDGIIDSKVVITPLDGSGRPMYEINDAVRRKVGDFFGRYKQHIPGASTSVPGWGTPEQGTELVRVTHAFFRDCRPRAGAQAGACVVARPK
jgi:inorganic pyrophosphatase